MVKKPSFPSTLQEIKCSCRGSVLDSAFCSYDTDTFVNPCIKIILFTYHIFISIEYFDHLLPLFLVILDPLHFHTNIRINLSISSDYCAGAVLARGCPGEHWRVLALALHVHLENTAVSVCRRETPLPSAWQSPSLVEPFTVSVNMSYSFLVWVLDIFR